MAKSLAAYYGAPVKTGNRRLSAYYGDQGQGFTTAQQISDVFAGNLEEYPSWFRRAFIIKKLGLKYQRELALLSDALYNLQLKGLIEFDHSHNKWKNMTRFT